VASRGTWSTYAIAAVFVPCAGEDYAVCGERNGEVVSMVRFWMMVLLGTNCSNLTGDLEQEHLPSFSHSYCYDRARDRVVDVP
jgi:hypothetical protein